jgi:hypothetical protein
MKVAASTAASAHEVERWNGEARRCLTGFRAGFCWAALDGQDMREIVEQLPCARLVRDGHDTAVQVSMGEVAKLLAVAGSA